MRTSEETHIFFRPVGCCPTTGHFLFLAGLILSIRRSSPEIIPRDWASDPF
jgi:hypothetical protein